MKTGITLFILACIALLTLAIAPMIGIDFIPWSAIWHNPDGMEAGILRDLRIPRTLTGFLVGSALALSGMTFQAMFRNPLATPFTLGTASGASLGAALCIRFGLTFSFLGLTGISFAAFAGSLLAVGLVYGLTRLKKGFSTATLLLAGVAVSFFFSSLILFINYISGFANTFRIIRWMMGSVDLTGYAGLSNMLPFVSLGALGIVLSANELNLLMTGDDIAASRGMNVDRRRHCSQSRNECRPDQENPLRGDRAHDWRRSRLLRTDWIRRHDGPPYLPVDHRQRTSRAHPRHRTLRRHIPRRMRYAGTHPHRAGRNARRRHYCPAWRPLFHHSPAQ